MIIILMKNGEVLMNDKIKEGTRKENGKGNDIGKRTGVKRTKEKLIPLDPRMYRITYEEFKKSQNKDSKQLSSIRGLSAHERMISQGKATPSKTDNNYTLISKSRFNSKSNHRENAFITAKDIIEKTIASTTTNNNNKSQDNNKNDDNQANGQEETEELAAITSKEKETINGINNLLKQSHYPPKDQCYYCLQTSTNPITLKCSHIICHSCIEENAKILSLINPLISLNNQSFLFKCPKCNDQSSLLFPSLPLPLIPSHTTPSPTQPQPHDPPCSLCQISSAEHDCLNCDQAICSQCKVAHLSNPLTQKHKIVPYQSPNKTSQDITKCPIHQVAYEFFCLNEQSLICPKCAVLLHKDHYYKQLWEVDSYFHNELLKEIATSKSLIKRITAELSTLNKIGTQLTNDSDYYTKEAMKYYDRIVSIIESHQAIMQNRIKEWFNIRKGEVNAVIAQLTMIKERFAVFINYHPYSNLEKMQQIRNMNTMNENIGMFDFNTLKRYSILSYRKYSTFRHEPIKSIEHALSKFSFLPLDLNAFASLSQCFKGSNILTKDSITADLLVVLPKITEGRLLYRISEIGPSPEEFHKACDYKGATLLFVKTDTGHIFGGFNPIDWKNQFSYDECDSSFLFSITDGKIRKPMKCKIKKVMKEYAIKQNEAHYSPGFGLSDHSDLFIAFKHLNNSYSKLGIVYKCPKGYQSHTFLAGKSANWKIQDCEVYSIDYLTDSDYYALH